MTVEYGVFAKHGPAGRAQGALVRVFQSYYEVGLWFGEQPEDQRDLYVVRQRPVGEWVALP
jgi:hypothetical protein